MAARANAVITDSLSSTWSQTTTVANALIALTQRFPANGAAMAPKARLHMTQLGWSIKNTAASAATVGVTVRDASIAGTVLAKWDFVTPATASTQDCFEVSIQGLRGNPLWVGTDTAVSTTSVSLNLMGWADTLGDG